MICDVTSSRQTERAVTHGSDRLLDEERRAVAAAYERYATWLRARLTRRYGSQDAEDLVQETWLKVAPYAAAETIRHPKALLLKIASNLAATKYGRQGREAHYERDIGRTTGWGIEEPTQTDDVFARQLVLGLPQPLRDVFVLSRFGGLTNSQIAEQLGISPKTVEWRMTKALAHCAAQLRR